MKKSSLINNTFLFFVLILFMAFTANTVSAAVFYTNTEYNNLYNEKVAFELELNSLKRQFSNEKANLEAKIKELEGEIDSLNKKIALGDKKREEDQRLSDQRVKELQATINLLQKKGGDREKDLIEENKKLQSRYEAELKKAMQDLQDERDKSLKNLDLLRKSYDSRIAELQATIKSLNDDMSSLKKLTKAQKDELTRMSEQTSELEKQLKDEIEKGQIRLKKMHGKLIINIDDRISFDSGSSELKKEILPALDKITKILGDYPENTIVVEGHTDNVPIHTKQFRDNWQLSTERALSVLAYLLKNKNLNRSRFGAAGYGEYNPIVSNDTPANRSLNRRVDIVVVPRVK